MGIRFWKRPRSWRAQPYFACCAFLVGSIAIGDGFCHSHSRAEFFSIGSLALGFIALFLGISSSIWKSFDVALSRKMSKGLTLTLIFAVLAFSGLGVYFVYHAGPDETTSAHTIALLTNIIPGLSAAVAISSKFDFDLKPASK